MLNRRQFIQGSMCAYLSFKNIYLKAQTNTNTFPLKKKLLWINMSGGWDILEICDPKQKNASDLDILYDYGLTHELGSGARLGRWLPRLSAHAENVLAINGLVMGTSSHNVGATYMDTGVLSNAGRVNSASIPAIVASEGTSTIPILQLSGGMSAQTDRGLLNKVSVVRAENLDLYRNMYPSEDEEILKRLQMIDYLKERAESFKQEVGIGDGSNDRFGAYLASQDKVREQIEAKVGLELALSDLELTDFMSNAPLMADRGLAQTFALSLKLISSDICDCINLGMGGFDTHAGQSARLEPILTNLDFALTNLIEGLKKSGKLDSTLIVLYSDFGRTPKVNGMGGRDHWPVGSALMIGGGLRGGRSVGATDENLNALSINPDTGLVDVNGLQLNPTHLGGSVLKMCLGEGYLGFRNYLTAVNAIS